MENIAIEGTEYETLEEKWLEKKNEQSISNLWNNIKQSSICVIKVTKGKESKRKDRKIFQEINGQKFSKFDETCKPTDGSSVNPKQKRHEENHSKVLLIKLLKMSDKEKILKMAQEKKRYITERGKNNDSRLLIKNHVSQGTM